MKLNHRLFFNKDSKNPLPRLLDLTSNAHPIIEPVTLPVQQLLVLFILSILTIDVPS